MSAIDAAPLANLVQTSVDVVHVRNFAHIRAQVKTMQVQIIHTKTLKIAATVPVSLGGLNYRPSKAEVVEEAWQSAVKAGRSIRTIAMFTVLRSQDRQFSLAINEPLRRRNTAPANITPSSVDGGTLRVFSNVSLHSVRSYARSEKQVLWRVWRTWSFT